MIRRRFLWAAPVVALVAGFVVRAGGAGTAAAPVPPPAATSAGPDASLSPVASPSVSPATTSPPPRRPIDRRAGPQPGVRPGSPTPSSSTAPAPGPSPSAGGTPSLDDLLERHDPVPPGVAEQISIFSGGGTDCQGILPEPLSVGVTDVRTVPGVPVICVNGFGDADLTVTVTTPSGRRKVITRAGTAEGGDSIPYPLGPGSETGKYLVRVDQNKETAATEFKVERATTPTLWITPEHVAKGEGVDVLLGGFPAAGPVSLHLYVCGRQLRYRTTLTAAVDATGQARVTLPTSTRTPDNCYVLINPLVYDPLAPRVGSLPPHLMFWVD
ncbi:hypothetical protein AB0M54_36185 [Actinoplanes sp. NPDC051470]|uniref:hypothetical protein n=1 Tax=unclassified Actinoplanes TaxID=2626549 RepID=UPI0034150571